MKIIKLLLTIMFLSFAWVTYAQVTVGIPDTAVTGSGSIKIPIKVTNFNDIGAISLKINYDPSVLTFQVEQNLLPGTFIENASNGVISISWFGLTPLNIGNGTLLNLTFNYNGVGSSSLAFNKAQSEITNSSGTTVTTASSFKDGSIFSATNPPVTFTIPAQTYTTYGMDITAPVNVTNFNNIGSTTLKIKYDPTVLTFKNIANAPAGFQASAASGVITVSYTTSSAYTFGNGKLFDLLFNYVGGNSALQFTQQTVSNILGQALTVTANNGSVAGPTAPMGTASLSIPDTNVSINTSINVPVNAKNFSNIGSISLKLNYNSSVLTFKGLANKATSDNTWFAQADAANGVITIGWSSPDAYTPINLLNGKLFDLQFDFKEGSSTLVFNSNSEITNLSNQKVSVTFNNGSVSAPRQIALGNIKANVGDTVKVPLTVNNLKNIGSISLQFTYNTSVLKYVGLDSDAVGFTASDPNSANGTVTLGWSSNPPAVKPLNIVSGTLTNVKFVYTDNTSSLDFKTANCQITDTALNTITGISYISGSVSKNISFELGKVRGTTGSDVAVPVNIKNITNIGSMSVKINYDPTKLTFKQIKNFNGDSNKLQAYSAPGSGVLTIGYADVTPLNVLQSKVFDLVFTYNSNTTAPITFASGNLLTDVNMAAISGVVYSDGSISPNQKPVITGVAPKIVAEGSPLTFNITATDPENDPVTIASSNLPTGATLSVKGAFAWTPGYDQAGTYNVKFSATDSLGALDTTSVLITVNNTNRKPTFTSVLPDTTIQESQALTYTYTATDPDAGTTLTYSLINPPAGAAINATTGVFNWTPTYDQAGTFNIKAVVSDGLLADTSRVSIVIVTNKDRAPKFTKTMPDTTISENTPLVYQFIASDPDSNTTLTYSISGAPTGAAINSTTGSFTWTPTYTQAGTYSFKAFVSDGQLKDSANVNIVVKDVNRAPKFTQALTDTTISENSQLKYVYIASDPDGDAVSYSLANAPDGASINAANGVFTWTPSYSQSGTYNLKVYASDGKLKDSVALKIVVKDVHRAPVFTQVLTDQNYPTVSDTIGLAFNFTYKGSSPENLPISFFISKAPAKATINALTGILLWDNGKGTLAAGKYVITVGLTDLQDTVYTSATITVAKPTGVMELGGIPTDYSISQNYPNPFNPTTVIRYSVPKESKVVVKVYNTIGQEVATLVNRVQNVGNYAVNFDASKLTSGIYIYRIQADKFVSTKKMILVK